ncbi:hypothetical protein Hanom_Chr04g00314531 [Helianthus anomalus]
MDQKSNKNKPNKSTVENKPEPKYHHQIQEHTNQDQTPNIPPSDSRTHKSDKSNQQILTPPSTTSRSPTIHHILAPPAPCPCTPQPPASP